MNDGDERNGEVNQRSPSQSERHMVFPSIITLTNLSMYVRHDHTETENQKHHFEHSNRKFHRTPDTKEGAEAP